jgi:hypothetical protein
VDPKRLQGIVVRIISKSIRDVFLVGCLLNIILITLGSAEPATIGWVSVVDSEGLNRNMFMSTVTLKSPMDRPTTLTTAEPSGMRRK